LVSVNLAEKIIMVAVLRSVALYIRLLNILPAGLACSRLDRLLPYRPRAEGGLAAPIDLRKLMREPQFF